MLTLFEPSCGEEEMPSLRGGNAGSNGIIVVGVVGISVKFWFVIFCVA